jgi:hypothetical protein
MKNQVYSVLPLFPDIYDCNSILTIEILHILHILKLICAYSNKL